MSTVLVVGSGHLAYRIRAMAQARGCTLVSPEAVSDAGSPSTYEGASRATRGVELSGVDHAFVVDDRDERNLELLLALVSQRADLPISASFYNENIAPHLRAAYPNVRILNPARLAAPVFLAALDSPVQHKLRYVPARVAEHPARVKSDALLGRLAVAFGTLVLVAIAFFHFVERLSWLDATYFVVVTVGTVGYGDISMRDSSALSKMGAIALITASTFFVWMIFSLTVDRLIKRRAQLALGRWHHRESGHVIVCGLGRLGYFVADGLLERGERVLIVEKSEDAAAIEHFRARGADVYIGDARLPRVLDDVGVTRAKALYSVIDADYINLEVGLNARSFAPDLRLVLRIFDEAMSKRVAEQLDIHLSYSMTAIADGEFFGEMK